MHSDCGAKEPDTDDPISYLLMYLSVDVRMYVCNTPNFTATSDHYRTEPDRYLCILYIHEKYCCSFIP